MPRLVLNLPANRSVQVTQAVGDSVLAGQDVDLYRFNGAAGDLVTIVATPTSGNLLYARLFDAAGNQLAADAFSGPASSPRIVAFRLPAAGNYYIGLSGWANTGYNPTVAGSGANGGTGNYQLRLERLAAGAATTSGLTAAAATGTPHYASLDSAHSGQTITLTGTSLTSADRVVFTAADGNGTYYTIAVAPSSVAPNGSSLEVVVPAGTVSGLVRLEARESVGSVLQVIPTLVDLDQGQNDIYHNGGLRNRGTGFVEGGMEILFGATVMQDFSNSGEFVTSASTTPKRTTGSISWSRASFPSVRRGSAVGAAPQRIPARVRADRVHGHERHAGQSAVALGQPRPGDHHRRQRLRPLHRRGVPDVDSNGTLSQRVVRPLNVTPDGQQLTVVVPLDGLSPARWASSAIGSTSRPCCRSCRRC